MKKLIILCLIMALWQGQAMGEKGVVRINDSWLNVRKEPRDMAKVIGKLENGVEIEYENIENCYSYLGLKSGDSVIGYIASVYVEREPKTKGLLEPKGYVVLCDIDMVSDIKGEVEIIGSLVKGQEIDGVVINDNWVRIVGGGLIPKAALRER